VAAFSLKNRSASCGFLMKEALTWHEKIEPRHLGC
jgi:hypothetical protein